LSSTSPWFAPPPFPLLVGGDWLVVRPVEVPPSVDFGLWSPVFTGAGLDGVADVVVGGVVAVGVGAGVGSGVGVAAGVVAVGVVAVGVEAVGAAGVYAGTTGAWAEAARWSAATFTGR
jgi:hypothetical protein